MTKPLRIALTKGRLEKDTVGLLEKLGYNCEPVHNKGTRLILPIPDGNMEGVLSNIAPDINMVEIARARLAADFLHNFNFKKELKNTGRSLLKSVRKMIDLPSMTTDLMDEFMKGQSKVNLDLRVSKDLAFLLRRLVRNIVMGLWVMALLISSSIICTTDMTPKFMGIPALGAFGYLMAVVIMIYVFVKHIFSRK